MSSGVLKRTLSAPQFFAVSFAAIVGVGWIVVLGDWLRLAGPMGAFIAFLAAGAVMMLVGMCYAEVCTSIPSAGGEFAYVFAAFGTRAGFAIGWILVLVYISATAFEGLSVGWLAGTLFPTLAGSTIYLVHGTPVTTGTLALGMGGSLGLTLLNLRGAQSSGRFQSIATLAKVGVAIVLVGAGLAWGHAENLRPWFVEGRDGRASLHGTLAVFVTAPFWLAGFNTLAQLMEERGTATTYKSIVTALLASIGAAATFYSLLVLSAAMAIPWRDIPRLEFPAIGAFSGALHSDAAAKAVLLIGLIGLLATWNALFIAASRLLYALARARMISHQLAYVSAQNGAPLVAVVIVGLISGAGILLGRSAILPIINVDAACFMLVYAVVALTMMRMRHLEPQRLRPYSVPAGTFTGSLAMAASVFMFSESMYLAWKSSASILPAEWLIFLAWTMLGVMAWMLAARTRAAQAPALRRQLIMGTTEGTATMGGLTTDD